MSSRREGHHDGAESEPMKILHLLAPADVGGLETVVATLAEGQAHRGAKVLVAMLAEDGRRLLAWRASLEERNVPVRTLLVGNRRYLSERRIFGQLLDSWGPDIVHTHGYRPDVVDAGVARGRGIPTVTTVHGFTGGRMKNRFYEWLQRRAFRQFDAVVAVSKRLARDLTEAGVSPARVRTVQNAWAPSAGFLDRDAARARLGLDAERLAIGWIGRLTPEKDPELMLRAFAILEKGETVLAMLGQGRMLDEVHRLSETLGVKDRVVLPGLIPQAARLLRAFDVLALTSRTEGTPMVLLEAMAAGTPIVSRAVGGVPEMLSEEEAFLVHSDDQEAMALALSRALGSPTHARAKASRALRRLEEEFSVGPWVERYFEVYASVRP